MKQRLRVKKVLTPGFWLDQNGDLHVSISDILDDLGWDHSDENKAIVERQVQEFMVKNFEGVKFVAVGACLNCGIGDGEEHLPGCELA